MPEIKLRSTNAITGVSQDNIASGIMMTPPTGHATGDTPTWIIAIMTYMMTIVTRVNFVASIITQNMLVIMTSL